MIGRKLLAPAAVLLLMACGPANTDAPSATMSPGHSPVASAASPSATATPSSTPKAPEPNTVAAGDDALVGDVLLLPASLVLIGSIGGSPAIWTSTVGETWQMQAEEALGATGHLADVIEHDGLVLAVGWRSERVGGAIADEPLVVAGGNGDAWRVLGGLPLPPDVRAQLHGIATDGRRVVIGGLLSDGSLAAWVTTDSGVTWAGPNVFPTEPGSSIAAMTFADNEFLAVGESIGQQSGPGVWRSRDGLEWSADDLLARGGSIEEAKAKAHRAAHALEIRL